jgi:thiamine pyrophosphate-dependent acetolactate synthase large subunit-like protein
MVDAQDAGLTSSQTRADFRGLRESFINPGGNKAPEWLTCTHEQAAVNIANGYDAVAGKPMAMITFAPSGLQHAVMGIFGAFSGRTPTYLLCANILDGAARRPAFDWGPHAMQDPADMVRDMLKWDDTPGSLQHFADRRYYKLAMTEPRSSDAGRGRGAAERDRRPIKAAFRS